MTCERCKPSFLNRSRRLFDPRTISTCLTLDGCPPNYPLSSHGIVSEGSGDRDDDKGILGSHECLVGSIKISGWGAIPDLPSFRWKSPAVISRGQNTLRKNMLGAIEEIRSCLVRHLQSMGGHDPNMGPPIFMAV